MNFREQYGPAAIVFGASEGIGAAFSEYVATQGVDVILVARDPIKLERLQSELMDKYKVEVTILSQDLSAADSVQTVFDKFEHIEIGLVVYNAALSFIGPFLKNSLSNHQSIAQVNMLSPLAALHLFGDRFLSQGKGGFILMASLAGFQGSGYLSMYAASKAFDRVLAEGLWYEWKNKGVDIIACCAGATASPNYIKTQPEKSSFFAPKVQLPSEVVAECMSSLGKRPSIITGKGNRIASFFMQRILPRKLAVKIMGDNTKKMYRLG
jgi:short-subunit dehydrogenase